MADAEEIADKVLAAIGGIGGAIVGVAGGGDGGAKATREGVDAIRGIVSDATGRTERKRAEAEAKDKAGDREDRELEKQRLALEERKLKLQEDTLRAQAERDKIRAYDAPMFPARPRGAQPAATVLSWQPSTLNPDDRIVEILNLPDKSPPLVNDARQSVILRRGDSRDVVLVDAGPLVDGAQPPTSKAPGTPPNRPALTEYLAANDRRFERAGDPHHVDDPSLTSPTKKEA